MKQCISFLVLILLAQQALAKTESHENILATVRTFIDANYAKPEDTQMQVTLDRIDPRLRLPLCQNPLEAFLPSGHQINLSVTVGVRCDSEQPWTVYIPVKIKLLSAVIVSTRPLARGDELTENDLTVVEKDLNRIRQGFYRTPEELIGKVMKSSISAGRIINPQMVTMPVMIKRGQVINIIAKTESVEVRMNGIALQDGVIGEHIKVKNTASNKIVFGIVTRSGDVQVLL